MPLSYFGKEGKNTAGASKGQIVMRGFLESKAAKAAPPSVAPEQPVAPVATTASAAVESAKPTANATPEPAKPAQVTEPAATAPVVAPVLAPAPAAQVLVATADKVPTPAAAAPTSIPVRSAASSENFDDTLPLKLRLSTLGVRDLKNTGGVFDKQDPALRITVGDNKPFETKR